MIVGVGVDVVGLDGFDLRLRRTPRMAQRLFTDAERGLRPESLAAIFAAKEAVAKALGAPGGLRWHDVEVGHEPSGRPYLTVEGTVAEAAEARRVSSWHLSLAHDGGVAIAMVIAEGDR